MARPTAHKAPGRRSIQMRISSRVPSSPTPWITRSAKRDCAESGPTREGYNPPVPNLGERTPRQGGFFSKLFGKRDKSEATRGSMSKEESLAGYVVREHRSGRSLEEI